MILTDEEAEKRLNSPDNLINKVQVLVRNANLKSEGDTKIPSMVRSLIGSLSNASGESDKEIGAVFGVSQPTVSNSGRGLVGSRKDDDLSDSLNTARNNVKQKTEDAHNLALDSLMSALSVVSPRLEESKDSLSLKELTRTSKDLSTVITNIQRNKVADMSSGGNNTLVILHSTERRAESKYEVLDV